MTRRSVKPNDSRYQELRERNNKSVQKSREKSRRERHETLDSIKLLEEENEEITKNLQVIKEEYQQLRDLFKQHTGMDLDQLSSSPPVPPTLPPVIEPPVATKPVLNIQTTEESTNDKEKLDAENLDGSIVVINGIQYKIVSMNK